MAAKGGNPLAATLVEHWPTTLRFSRRMGEAVRGAEYAAAIEVPRYAAAQRAAFVLTLVIALLSTALLVVWHMS
jgi:hypothetical protein